LKLHTGVLLAAAGALVFIATRALPETEEENTDWSNPKTIVAPSDSGNVKGIVRIRPLPRKEHEEEEDPLEAKKVRGNVKSLFVPRKNLLWIGAAEYEHFFVMKDRIAALSVTAGADLSLNIVRAPIPKSSNADKALREEMDAWFKKVDERPLRYQYWIDLRRLFGRDAFLDEHNPDGNAVPSISKIVFDKGNAVVTLVGKDGGVFTLTFDQNLQVVAASQNGHPVPMAGPVALGKITADVD